MSDLAERLRNLADWHGPEAAALMKEAADEIERLRKERDRMVEAMERIGKQSPEYRLLVQHVWQEVNQ